MLFLPGKSPCGMQLAGQGLVKLNSGKIQFQILYIHCKPYHFLYKLGVSGLGGPPGLSKTKVFFQGGCSTLKTKSLTSLEIGHGNHFEKQFENRSPCSNYFENKVHLQTEIQTEFDQYPLGPQAGFQNCHRDVFSKFHYLARDASH